MRFYYLIILLFCSVICKSQNCDYTLSGTVIDSHDGSPLSEAILIIAGLEIEIKSNNEGLFSIPNLCKRSYSIQVYHQDCSVKGYTVKIDGNTSKVFRLEHHLEELNEITIKGETKEKTKTLVENKLSKEQLEQYSGGSLGDALNSLSGVSSLNTGNTVVKPLINGLHSSRVVIINNGVRMEDQEWGSEHAPNVDINTAGSITLIKGAGALQYSGDAVGGIIITEPPRIPVMDTIYGKTITSGASNGRGGTLTSQLTKSFESGWHASLQGTLKRFGDYESPDYVLSNTGIFERNGSFRAGLNKFNYGFEGYYSFFKNEIGILRASHIGGAQDQVNAINSNVPSIINDFTYNINAPKQDVTHHLVRLSGFKKFEKFGKLNAQYNFQRNNRLEFDIRRGDDADKASLDLELDTHTFSLDLDSNLSESTKFKAGVFLGYQKNFADPNTGVRRLIPDYDKQDIGIYSTVDHNINTSWSIEAGARFDYTFMDVLKFYRTSFWESRNYDVLFPELVVQDFGTQVLTNPELIFSTFSATAGATYSINEHNKFYFNYSLASRPPNPSELFSEGLHHSASRIELGDLSFTQELAHKFALTFQKKHELFNFSINPYINTINDFIIIEPTQIRQTIRGNFQVWEYRQTNAQLLGVDIDAALAITEKVSFNHQFSVVKGYDRTKNTPLINMPAANTKNEITYKNEKLNNLKIGLQSEFVFEQNEFPNTNFEVFIPEIERTELVDLSTPPEAYHLLNLKSNIDFKLTLKSILNVGLSVTNLFNTSYRNYLNRLRYYADDIGRNINLTLKINY